MGAGRRVLITNGASRTGRAVVAACAGRDLAVRAFVPGLDQVDAASNAGAREVVQGRFADEAALMRALLGVDAIYHVAPAFDPDELTIGARVIEAARAAGVHRFVYHSVLHPHIASIPHHWRKMRVEEMLLASGLEVTVLQPAPYVQDLLALLPAIRSTGLYVEPCPIATRVCRVDLCDVAEVAARVLAEEAHGGATYELVGTPPLSRLEIAGIFSEHLHMPVRAIEQKFEDWEGRCADLPPDRRETLRRMYGWYAAHGLAGSPTVLRFLLGREPTSLDACLGRTRARSAVAGSRAAS